MEWLIIRWVETYLLLGETKDELKDVAFGGEIEIEEGDGDDKELGPKEVETNKEEAVVWYKGDMKNSIEFGANLWTTKSGTSKVEGEEGHWRKICQKRKFILIEHNTIYNVNFVNGIKTSIAFMIKTIIKKPHLEAWYCILVILYGWKKEKQAQPNILKNEWFVTCWTKCDKSYDYSTLV